MNKDKLDTEVAKGQQAKRLLEDELFIEAFDIIRVNLHGMWENSPASDGQGREHAWLMLKAVNEVHRHIESVMNTGKLAAMQLDEEEKKS